jgi:hypothetical protein
MGLASKIISRPLMIIVHDFTGSPDFDVLPFFPQACDRLPIAPRNNE